MEERWLPGWSVVNAGVRKSDSSVYERYRDQCALMQGAGKELFALGALPEFLGTSAPAIFQAGTGGNFAIRSKKFPRAFVVTARGAHKGSLSSEHFVEVVEVYWSGKIVYVHRDRDDIVPSTDTLLVATAFGAHSDITTWVHFHRPVKTSRKVRLLYPAFGIKDRKKFTSLIERGARVINMVDHNLFLKSAPDGTQDAAIILGEDPKTTFDLASRLIRPA